MSPRRDALWDGGREKGRGKRLRGGAFLVVFFRQEAEDEFTHAEEVDHLGDAEQRGDDQRSAVRPLQEGRRTLIAEDFPEEEAAVSQKDVVSERAVVFSIANHTFENNLTASVYYTNYKYYKMLISLEMTT